MNPAQINKYKAFSNLGVYGVLFNDK